MFRNFRQLKAWFASTWLYCVELVADFKAMKAQTADMLAEAEAIDAETARLRAHNDEMERRLHVARALNDTLGMGTTSDLAVLSVAEATGEPLAFCFSVADELCALRSDGAAPTESG